MIFDKNIMNKQNLVNKIYKLLPIYEGKIIEQAGYRYINEDIAYENFKRNLDLAILEFNGIKKIYPSDEKTIDSVLCILYGLKDIGIKNKNNVKNAIFKCIRYIKQME